MKRFIAAPLLILTAGLAGCINFQGWQAVEGSGNIVSQSRPVSQFNRVSISGAGDLTLVQGDEESLTIEADDNLLPYIRTESVNGRLSIGPHNVNLRGTQAIRYRLKLKNLEELDISGSARSEMEALKSDRLVLRVSGSGTVQITHLDGHFLLSEISGSGRTLVAGRVEREEIRISGSGNHHSPELECSQAQAHISGSGHASIWVVDSLSAHISGSGRVEYRGKPRIDSHISGSGRVRHAPGGD